LTFRARGNRQLVSLEGINERSNERVAVMKKLLLASAFALGLATTPASADPIVNDPLHGMVCSGAGTGCTNAADQGSYTPIDLSVTQNWAFSISPGPASGDLTLAFLVPTNEVNTATFNLPGLTEGLSTSVSTTVFSRSSFYVSGSPDLAVFLGLPNGASY